MPYLLIFPSIQRLHPYICGMVVPQTPPQPHKVPSVAPTLKDCLKTTSTYLGLLAANGIKTMQDFFQYFPRTFEDRKNIVLLKDLQSEQVIYTVKMLVEKITILKTGRGKKIITYACVDETGAKATINFFYAQYLIGHIKLNQRYLIIGKPKNSQRQIQFWHPEMVLTEAPTEEDLVARAQESGALVVPAPSDLQPSSPQQQQMTWSSTQHVHTSVSADAPPRISSRQKQEGTTIDSAIQIDDPAQAQDVATAQATYNTPDRVQAKIDDAYYQTNRIYPVYPEMLGIKASWFAKRVRDNRHLIPQLFPEYLPRAVVQDLWLLDYTKTIQSMHYPESMEDALAAQRRVSFDKLLGVQLSSIMQRHAYQDDAYFERQAVNWDLIKDVVDALPFTLTTAQKKALKAIIENLHEGHPMMRLLQGDVGSGKTIVAAIAAYYVVKQFGAQAAFLAPLEVLAQQHHRSIAKILLPLGIRIECITGSTTPSEKRRIKTWLERGTIDIVIGTHALLQDDVEFKHLFLAVIDEQHKFWVRQRAFFKKFNSPHLLQMTATPIPRSMALAFFGEFDVSTIDEMPAWRKPIVTKIVSEAEYKKLKQWVITKLSQDQRVFIVVPLIEDSEVMVDLKSAMQEFEDTKALYTELSDKIWLLHGKMKPDQKAEVMAKFKKGDYMILVSTTVIEVGIDVPEATIMIIKNADRFGLAQSHQLRGRVGRSDIQSYCFLETKHKTGESYTRLRALEQYTDGFKLAELDLKYRGAGEFLGTRQSWVTDIPYEMMADTAFLESIQRTARGLLEKYPGLTGLDVLQKNIETVEGELLV